MASIVYPLILFIFIFGAGMTYINETEMYQYTMPDSGLGSQISDSQMQMQEQTSLPGLSLAEQAIMLIKCVAGGLLALATLYFILTGLGIPVGLAGVFISPLGIVVAFWLVEMWLGRTIE